MKLTASLIVKDELGRYLEDCVGSLLEFCDEIRVVDDGSTDGTYEWFRDVHGGGRVQVLQHGESEFFEHEGRARNALLDWTLSGQPSHVIAVDADEFVADGAAVRRACEQPGDVWTLDMEEVWEFDGDCLCVREDGGWRSHPVPVLWRVPARLDESWRIADRALACGREPVAVRRLPARAKPTGSALLHFGWANEAERVARHRRYAVADGGRYHAGSHLASILWADRRVRLRGREWPEALLPRRAAIEQRAAAGAVRA